MPTTGGTGGLVDPQDGSVPADRITCGQQILAAQRSTLVVGNAGATEGVVADIASLVGGVASVVGVVETGTVPGRHQERAVAGEREVADGVAGELCAPATGQQRLFGAGRAVAAIGKRLSRPLTRHPIVVPPGAQSSPHESPGS